MPQPGAANRAITWPRGKVLGGSSAINGLYAVRPSKLEVDAWGALVPGGVALTALKCPTKLNLANDGHHGANLRMRRALDVCQSNSRMVRCSSQQGR